MKTKKILAKLDSFFSLEEHRQKKRVAKLEKLLVKLKEREYALHKLLKTETRKRQCRQLENELKILHEQKQKAKAILKCKQSAEPTTEVE